jgi:hypothetical protein
VFSPQAQIGLQQNGLGAATDNGGSVAEHFRICGEPATVADVIGAIKVPAVVNAKHVLDIGTIQRVLRKFEAMCDGQIPGFAVDKLQVTV